MAEKIIIIHTRVFMDGFIICGDNDVLPLGTLNYRSKEDGGSGWLQFENLSRKQLVNRTTKVGTILYRRVPMCT
jgi:hypothetical protein